MICYVILLQSQAEVPVQYLKFMHVITNVLVMKTPIVLKNLEHIPCILF
jgi:hypothetical protein